MAGLVSFGNYRSFGIPLGSIGKMVALKISSAPRIPAAMMANFFCLDMQTSDRNYYLNKGSILVPGFRGLCSKIAQNEDGLKP